MYTVEFEADIKGDIIQISPKYKELFSKHVKIIVMICEKDAQIAYQRDWKIKNSLPQIIMCQ